MRSPRGQAGAATPRRPGEVLVAMVLAMVLVPLASAAGAEQPAAGAGQPAAGAGQPAAGAGQPASGEAPAAVAPTGSSVPGLDLPSRMPADGEDVVSLDGEWSFRTDPTRTGVQAGYPDPATSTAGWDTMTVPGNWDVHDEYATYRGAAWYRRDVTAPEVESGQRVRLAFGAVYWDSRVWLNGQLLGAHHGGYTPFEFDVTELLTEGSNVVAVEADNRFAQGAWWPWGGISRSVSLVTMSAVRIDRQEVVATPDLDDGTAAVSSTVFLSNAGDTDREITVTGRLTDADRTAELAATGDLSARVTVPAGGDAEATLSATLPAGSHELWHVDNPALYRFEATVRAGEDRLHTVSERFGIRSVQIDGTSILLNGEPIRMSGYNRVQDDRVSGNTEPTALVRRDLDQMKAAGANMMRLMCVPQATELLDYADEIGLLLITEVPVWGGDRDISPAGYPSIQAELTEMVHRDFNHPSVFAYSVANEIAAHTPTGREYDRVMSQFVRDLDPTRYVTQVSNSYTRVQRPEDDGSTYMDFVSVNMYGSFTQNADHAHRLWPDKPIFISEYSPDSFTFPVTREHLDFRTGAAQLTSGFAARPWLVGWSQWTYNDYRSSFGGSSLNQVRGWGVVDVWGRRKQAYDQVQHANAPVAGLRVSGGGADGRQVSLVELEPRGGDGPDAPAFALRGYRLVWQATDASGDVVAGRVVDLPVIEPGDDVLRVPVGWSGDGSAVTQQVSLLSPTGHEVAVARSAVRPPSAPSITDVVEAADSVRVRYEPVPGAESYRAEVRRAGDVVASVETVEAFADLTGLSDGDIHDVVVVAVNVAGESASEPMAVTPAASHGALPPRLSALVPVEAGLVLGYSDARAAGSYDVLVRDSRTGAEARRYETTLRGSTRIGDLHPGRSYEVRMRRLEADGSATAWSEPLSATTLAAHTVPDLSVHGVVAGPTSAGVRVIPTAGVERYVMTVARRGGPARQLTVERAGVDLVPVTGLEPGQWYTVTARAQTSTGESRPWVGQVRTPAVADSEPPPAPLGLSAAEIDGEMVLSWEPAEAAVGYLVTRDACGRSDVAGITAGTSLPVGPAGRSAGAYTVTSLGDGVVGGTSQPVVVDGSQGCTVVVTTADTQPRDDGTVPFIAAGAWSLSSLPGPDGASSLYSNQRGDTVTWTPELFDAGTYEVQAWFPSDANTTTAARYVVNHPGGAETLTVDQRAHGGRWLTLGTWSFEAGTRSSVVLEAAAAGFTRASSVRFVDTTVPARAHLTSTSDPNEEAFS